jgi:hypothetical protein
MSSNYDRDVRPAVPDDVPAIAQVLEVQRAEYKRYSPVFWRPAAGAWAAHVPFLRMLVEQEGPLAFVAASNADLEGSVIALPRSSDWLVDDFAVRSAHLWPTAGPPLLGAVRDAVPDRPVTVVSAERDDPKRTMLRSLGGRLAQQWWVRPLDGVAPIDSEPAGANGAVVSAPPVYGPGGQVCLVSEWDGSAASLSSLEAWAHGKGAVLAIVAVDTHDAGRQAVLRNAGYDVASEWYYFEPAGTA